MWEYRVLVVSDYKDTNFWKQFTTSYWTFSWFERLFQTTKIQTFESNSQRGNLWTKGSLSCFRLQRYKLLKAIHNPLSLGSFFEVVVSDYKDTNFWKQFTTNSKYFSKSGRLFQTTKIQTFESNSQRICLSDLPKESCFRLQRYKLLKAIHNLYVYGTAETAVVSDYKDTNFWKQFTTPRYGFWNWKFNL